VKARLRIGKRISVFAFRHHFIKAEGRQWENGWISGSGRGKYQAGREENKAGVALFMKAEEHHAEKNHG